MTTESAAQGSAAEREVSSTSSGPAAADPALYAEIDRLRAQLKGARGYEAGLRAELAAECKARKEAESQRDAAIEEFQEARKTSYLERAEAAESALKLLEAHTTDVAAQEIAEEDARNE